MSCPFRFGKALTYPLNPNGSPQDITGLITPDGRFSINDAAPRVSIPRRAEFLVSEGVAGEPRMVAHVPECEEVGG